MDFNYEEFIEKIKFYPELYHKGNKNYLDTKRKEKLWTEISNEFNLNARKKWNGLRDRYVREKKKLLQPSGSGAQNVSTWELFPLLQFLDDCIKPRRMIENTNLNDLDDSSCSLQFDDANVDWESSENPSGSSTPHPSTPKPPTPKPPTPQPQTKRQRVAMVDEVEKKILASLNNLNNKLHTVEKEETEDGCFLKSIEFSMRKMSDEEKTNYKILMLQKANEAINNSHNIWE